MSEEEKLRYLFKELSHNLFSVIEPTPPTTVQTHITECKQFEDQQSRQILQIIFDRLPEVTPSPPNTAIIPFVRDVIRNKFHNFLPRLMSQLSYIVTKRAVQE